MSTHPIRRHRTLAEAEAFFGAPANRKPGREPVEIITVGDPPFSLIAIYNNHPPEFTVTHKGMFRSREEADRGPER